MAHILPPKVAYRIKDENDPDGNKEYHCRVMADDHGVLFSCGLLRSREELDSQMIRDVDPATLCQHCFGPYLVRDTDEVPFVERRKHTAAPEDPEYKSRRIDDEEAWKIQARLKKKRRIAGAISLLAVAGLTWLLVDNSGVQFGQEISTTVQPARQQMANAQPAEPQQEPVTTESAPIAATGEANGAEQTEMEQQRAAAEQQLEAERLAQEKQAALEAEKKRQAELAAEQKRQKELAAEKKRQEELAAEKKRQEELAAEKKRQEELAAEKKRQEELAAEKKRQEELAAEKKRQEELAAEKKRQEELAAEKKRQEELAAEQEKQAAAAAPSEPATAAAPANTVPSESSFPPIGFADPMLELCVREALAIGPDTPITRELAATLTELDCSDTGIEKLEGVDQLPYLTKLNLSSNAITDIEPVVTLAKLTKLNLKNNQITDISSVTQLPITCDVNLLLNPIKDITPFILRSKQ